MKQKDTSDVISYQTGNNVGSNAQSGDWEKRDIPKIYLMYDLPDQPSVVYLRKYIAGEGYYILEPKFDGALHERRNMHQHNLISADMVMIYYGRENVQWLRIKLLDMLKSPGLGRNKPLMESAILIGQNVNVTKEALSQYRGVLIRHLDNFPAKPLKEFLNKPRKSYAAVSE